MAIVKANSEVTAKAIAVVELANALVEHLRHFWTLPCVELFSCSPSPLRHHSHCPLDHRHREPDICHHQHPSLVYFSPYHHYEDEELEYAYDSEENSKG